MTAARRQAGDVCEYACPQCPRRALVLRDGQWPFVHAYPLTEGDDATHWAAGCEISPQAGVALRTVPERLRPLWTELLAG
jgi:hypothetical protein